MNLVFIIVGVVLVALIFLFVKVKYLKHKLTWILILVGVFFLYATFMASTIGQDINYNSIEGLQEAGKIYLSWLGNGFENMKTLTGEVIKLDWGVDNIFN